MKKNITAFYYFDEPDFDQFKLRVERELGILLSTGTNPDEYHYQGLFADNLLLKKVYYEDEYSELSTYQIKILLHEGPFKERKSKLKQLFIDLSRINSIKIIKEEVITVFEL